MTTFLRFFQVLYISALLASNVVVAQDPLLRTRKLFASKKPTRKPTKMPTNKGPTRAPTKRNPLLCTFCKDGGAPTATLTYIYTNVTKGSKGFYCREYYQKSLYRNATDPYCIVAQQPEVQKRCGC